MSHSKKLSNLLDRINTALLSDMPEDCVCCNSVDINITDVLFVKYQVIYPAFNNYISKKLYYAPNVKSIILSTNHSRAPPVV